MRSGSSGPAPVRPAPRRVSSDPAYSSSKAGGRGQEGQDSCPLRPFLPFLPSEPFLPFLPFLPSEPFLPFVPFPPAQKRICSASRSVRGCSVDVTVANSGPILRTASTLAALEKSWFTTCVFT